MKISRRLPPRSPSSCAKRSSSSRRMPFQQLEVRQLATQPRPALNRGRLCRTLTQGRIGCLEDCLIVVVGQASEKITDAPERLAQEKFSRGVLLTRPLAVALAKLNFRIPA